MTGITSELARKVEEAIMNNEAFKSSWDINVIDTDGVITLRGAVPTKKQLQKIEEIAKSQEGVISVVNEVDIDTSLDEDPEKLDFENDVPLPPDRQGPYGRHK